jgi:hypothetical protein
MAIIIAIYSLGVIGFVVWDALVGFPFEFDGGTSPPIFLAAMFWFIALPICVFAGLQWSLEGVKNRRIERQEKKQLLRALEEREQNRLRVIAEKEVQAILDRGDDMVDSSQYPSRVGLKH